MLAGAFVVLEPFPILICLAVFLIAFGLTRIVSLGSIAAAVVFPVGGVLAFRAVERRSRRRGDLHVH